MGLLMMSKDKRFSEFCIDLLVDPVPLSLFML